MTDELTHNNEDSAEIKDSASQWQPVEPVEESEPEFLAKLDEGAPGSAVEPVVIEMPEPMPNYDPEHPYAAEAAVVEPARSEPVIVTSAPDPEPAIVTPPPQPVRTAAPQRPGPAVQPSRPSVAAPALTSGTMKPRPEGVTITAIYHFLVGVPLLLLSMFFLMLMMIMPVLIRDSAAGLTVTILVLGFVFTLFLVLGAVALITGVGLLKMKNWARWLAIIQSVFNLLNFPIGTVIGGIIIVYLLSEPVREAFELHA